MDAAGGWDAAVGRARHAVVAVLARTSVDNYVRRYVRFGVHATIDIGRGVAIRRVTTSVRGIRAVSITGINIRIRVGQHYFCTIGIGNRDILHVDFAIGRGIAILGVSCDVSTELCIHIRQYSIGIHRRLQRIKVLARRQLRTRYQGDEDQQLSVFLHQNCTSQIAPLLVGSTIA